MTTLVQKLRIKPGTAVRTVNAPPYYSATLGALPEGATIAKGVIKGHAFIHLFVKDKATLEKEFDRVRAALAPGGLLWIAFPKGTSGSQTDLTRDKGWEALERVPMRWLSMISFNTQWSSFLLQNAPPVKAGKASTDYHKAGSEWTDPATKTVRIPDDLEKAFSKNARARKAYEALSYTNRKEYVLWIVGAKRTETRSARVSATIGKLLAGKRNPSEK